MRSITVKTFMIIYLGALLILSAIMLRQPMRLLLALGIVVIYCATDLLWTYRKTKQWYPPNSSVISGLILSLILDTASHPYLVLIAPILAAASKHWLKFGRARHLFNPAAFAAVILSFFIPIVAWWGPSWGRLPLIVVALAGLYILKRTRRWPVVLSFLISYLAILWGSTVLRSGFFIANGLLLPLFFDGTLLFFASVMLIEPVTTSYPKPKDRLMFGMLVGALAALLSLLPRFWPLENMDPLLFVLVIGNLVTGLKTLKSQWVKNQ